MPTFPELWTWDLSFTGHAEMRMEQRGVTEVDLRAMLERATAFDPTVVNGRFVMHVRHKQRPWLVIVESDMDAKRQEGFTEYRPGNYVYFDRTQVALGAATVSDCALTVLATIVSKPAPDRIILDSGSKTLTNDGARGFLPTPGFGEVLDHPNLLVDGLLEEHATVKVTDGLTQLEPGDRVRIIPNHSRVVSNLVDHAWLIDGHEAAALEIAARGRIT